MMVEYPSHVARIHEPVLVGRSDAFHALMRRVDQTAKAQRTTLLTGPTGSGKDVVARLLHARSGRRGAPFNPVHCAALPEGLFDSELFGHQRGAFTGAQTQRAGLIRTANDGTMFLDEIDSLSLSMQSKLLRFLDTGEFRSVGADRSERSNAWIIAATNQDLEARVRAGTFREDLYFRLSAIRIQVPSLRERPEDIVALAEHFLTCVRGDTAAFSDDARAALMRHTWPGNVRELKHRVEAAALLHDTPWIAAEMLALGDRGERPEAPRLDGRGGGRDLEELLWTLIDRDKLSFPGAIARCERALISAALRAEENNRTRAAGRLGIHVRTIYKKLDGAPAPTVEPCPNGHVVPGRSQLRDRFDAE
jgi:DNA-binding NtrC family response regulator